MDVVRLIFRAWRRYGELYYEWNKAWEADDRAYRQKRALALLQCAIKFSEGMTDVSYRKHKSWYVYLTVWVVPRQMAARGNLWAYATGPIEQRGARMKRITRSWVSW